MGLFGTYKIDSIVSKKLINFKPLTPLNKVFKRIKNVVYSILRVNVKSFFKKTKLHPDLIK